MAQEIDARVFQKTDTLAGWMANPLILGPGEQAFVVSAIDGANISYKVGNGALRFSELPWPDYTVRAKVSPSFVFTGAPSGIYIPTETGTYSGVAVNLTEGYQVLYWDGTTLTKVVYPGDLSNYLSRTEAASTYVDGAFLFQLGKNLFNPNDPGVQLGRALFGGGSTAVSATTNISGFIPVTGSTVYTGSSVRSLEYYTAAVPESHIAFVNNESGGLTFTTPSTAKFVRITWRVSNYSTAQLELGSSATSYVPYSGPTVKPSLLPALQSSQITAGMITTDKIADLAITAGKTDFLVPTTNLININAADAQVGFLLSASTGTVTETGTSNTTGFVPVKPGVEYTIGSSPRVLVYYNSAKVRVSNVAIANPFPPVTFTPPAGAVYIRASFSQSGTNWTNARLNLGATLLAWERYGYYLGTQIIYPQPTTLKWSSMGDSITQLAKWQAKVASSLYLTNTNQGVGGSKMSGSDEQSMWQDVRVNAIPTDTDIITILAGSNDWSQSAPIGTISRTNVDTETYIGAYNVWLQKVYTRLLATKPGVRIFVMTPPVARRIGPPYPTGWGADGYINKLGLRTEDYAAAAREFARMWSLPLIDSARVWNTKNVDTYIPVDDGVHPNQLGADLISMEVIEEMKNRIRFN